MNKWNIIYPSCLIFGLLVITFGTFKPLEQIMLSNDWFTIGIKKNIELETEECPNGFTRYESKCILIWDISSIPDSAIITLEGSSNE